VLSLRLPLLAFLHTKRLHRGPQRDAEITCGVRQPVLLVRNTSCSCRAPPIISSVNSVRVDDSVVDRSGLLRAHDAKCRQ
jgi:hypothetical protein